MPSKEALDALEGVVEAIKRLFASLGPVASCIITAIVAGLSLTLYVLRGKSLVRGWDRALAAKDDMIRTINEQNRELRVQCMVVGGQLSKEEAVQLVYGGQHLNVEGSTEPAKSGDKR